MVTSFLKDVETACRLLVYDTKKFLSSGFFRFQGNIMTTCVGVLDALCPDLLRRGLLRPLNVCCDIWHQDVNSRSLKSWEFGGGTSMDLTCLSSADAQLI